MATDTALEKRGSRWQQEPLWAGRNRVSVGSPALQMEQRAAEHRIGVLLWLSTDGQLCFRQSNGATEPQSPATPWRAHWESLPVAFIWKQRTIAVESLLSIGDWCPGGAHWEHPLEVPGSLLGEGETNPIPKQLYCLTEAEEGSFGRSQSKNLVIQCHLLENSRKTFSQEKGQ